jgi:enamine deaminase RidA (YjgF/YER057c/UK114 family)
MRDRLAGLDSLAGSSQTRFINPPALGRPPGYTHVVEVTAPARIVYVAGQLGVDGVGKVVADFRRQAVQTFENLKTALAAVRAQFRNVAKFNNYLVDRAHLPTRCLLRSVEFIRRADIQADKLEF